MTSTDTNEPEVDLAALGEAEPFHMISEYLEGLEKLHTETKAHIAEGMANLDPRVYEVEHLVRMAIPLLRGVKAKLEPKDPS